MDELRSFGQERDNEQWVWLAIVHCPVRLLDMLHSRPEWQVGSSIVGVFACGGSPLWRVLSRFLVVVSRYCAKQAASRSS